MLPEDIAYDMKLYYEGYPASLQKHLHRRLTHEKERLMHVADQAHAASFTRFIDSEDDSLPPEELSADEATGPAVASINGDKLEAVIGICSNCKTQVM